KGIAGTPSRRRDFGNSCPHGSLRRATRAGQAVAGLGDGGVCICYDFARLGIELLARLAIHVQSLLQSEAQSLRDHSRSFVPVSYAEAQRSFGRSLLRGQ